MKLPCEINPHAEHDHLLAVWKACEKARRCFQAKKPSNGLRLRLQRNDQCHSGTVPRDVFTTMVACEVGNAMAAEEIELLADYFGAVNDRTSYDAFCSVIYDDVLPEVAPDKLSTNEHRKLHLLLMSIAQALRYREQVLRPYFEDQALVTGVGGTSRITYLKRVLYYHGITLGESELQLLVKRFSQDGLRFDYESFMQELDQLFRYLDRYDGAIDRASGEEVPQKVIAIDMPKVHRPEFGQVSLSDMLRKRLTFHPCFNASRDGYQIEELLKRIKRHIYGSGIAMRAFFEQFDTLRCGWMTKGQFIRCLDAIGLSTLHRLPLNEQEMAALCERYADPAEPSRIYWTSFVGEIGKRVYTNDDLRQELDKADEELLAQVLRRLRNKIVGSRILMEPVFRDFDPHNKRRVSLNQWREVFSICGLKLNEQEAYILDAAYASESGFNYWQFLGDAGARDIHAQQEQPYRKLMEDINRPAGPMKPTDPEQDIVLVLAKVKAQAVHRRLKVMDFMSGFDPLNHFRISYDQFMRGLATANIDLTANEMHLLCEVFRTPLLEQTVDYKRFCDTVAEIDFQPLLEKAPLLVPLRHFPAEKGSENFLNFDERAVASLALQKLARHADIISNVGDILRDYDRNKIGIVNRNQLLRALATRELHTRISTREFEVLCKYFAVTIGEEGCRREINYRALLDALHYLYANREIPPI